MINTCMKLRILPGSLILLMKFSILPLYFIVQASCLTGNRNLGFVKIPQHRQEYSRKLKNTQGQKVLKTSTFTKLSSIIEDI